MEHCSNLIPRYFMKCPVSRKRNKAKNALSLAAKISPFLARAKIQRNRFVQGKKREIRVFLGKQIYRKSQANQYLCKIGGRFNFVECKAFVSEKEGKQIFICFRFVQICFQKKVKPVIICFRFVQICFRKKLKPVIICFRFGQICFRKKK